MHIDPVSGKTPQRIWLALGVAAVIVLWAANFIAAKIGLRAFPALTLASFRVVLAGLFMIPIFFFAGRASAGTASRRFTGRDLWTFAYLGFFGVTVNQICFTTGLHYTAVGHSAVIVGMGPIYTLALAVALRLERATWRKALGMAIAFAGMGILAAENGISLRSASLLGDGITLIGSLGFATYAVLGKRVASRYDAVTMTALNHFAGALIVLPLAIHQAVLLGPSRNWRAVPWQAWAAAFYMALFASAAAYLLYYWLLRYLEASQLSAFTYLLPVIATVLGIVLLGERASWGQFLGGAIALGGVYCIESGRS